MRDALKIMVKKADFYGEKSRFCAPPITYLFGRLLAARNRPVFFAPP
jgi:hypothetical protein